MAKLAHDLANLLAIIGGTTAMLADDLDASGQAKPGLHSETREHIERIASCVEAACGLVDRLPGRTAEPRPGALTGDVFDLASALSEAFGLVRPIVPHPITLREGGLDGLPPMRAYGTALDAIQLVLNLVLNARDALHRGEGAGHESAAPPSITVSCRHGLPQPGGDVLVGSIVPGRTYAIIRVSDNGPGLAASVVSARIGEALSPPRAIAGLHVPGLRPQSVKGGERPPRAASSPTGSEEAEERRGRGWGLRIVAEIVDRTGGALRLCAPGEAAPGRGTTVEVAWPLVPDRRVPDLTGRLVMLIAGEPARTGAIANAFEAAGAEVALCLDARDAVQSLADDHGEWDVAVIAGDTRRYRAADALASLRRVDPGLPIVALGVSVGLSDGDVASEHAATCLPAGVRPLEVLLAAETLVPRPVAPKGGVPCAS